MDLQNELYNEINNLDIAVKQLRNNGRNYAKAFTDYRIELAKELLKLKKEGYAISLAGDIARGKEHIAKLKFEEIAKEAIYKANQESILATKLKIKIIENQIEREWNNE